MATQIVTRETSCTGQPVSVLTDRGAAAVALLRFERLLRALGPADRRWFAGELAELPREAAGSA